MTVEGYELANLIRERPDLWHRALTLATTLTKYNYAPKLPLSDGTIYACYAYEPTPEERERRQKQQEKEQKEREEIREREELERVRRGEKTLKEINLEDGVKYYRGLLENQEYWNRREPLEEVWKIGIIRERKNVINEERALEEERQRIKRVRAEIEQRKPTGAKQPVPSKPEPPKTPGVSIDILDEIRREEQIEEQVIIEEQEILYAAPRVFVPPGAMEWILHEVGHYVASTPEERLLPNYGVGPSETGSDGEREWQAWAFEEIVLAPFGPARTFAPPTQRDGAAFSKPGPMPLFAMRHTEHRMAELRVDVEEWRVVYGEWIRYERGLVVPSWKRFS